MSWTETEILLVWRLFLVDTRRRVASKSGVTKACASGTGEYIHARSFSRLPEIAISVPLLCHRRCGLAAGCAARAPPRRRLPQCLRGYAPVIISTKIADSATCRTDQFAI